MIIQSTPEPSYAPPFRNGDANHTSVVVFPWHKALGTLGTLNIQFSPLDSIVFPISQDMD